MRLEVPAARQPSNPGRPDHPLFTREWRAALRRGARPTPAATLLIVAVCVGLWVAAVVGGAPVWSSHAAVGIERDLARNAAAIVAGQWWRAATYGFVTLGIEALAFVMALLILAGAQIERTYATARSAFSPSFSPPSLPVPWSPCSSTGTGVRRRHLGSHARRGGRGNHRPAPARGSTAPHVLGADHHRYC